MEKRPKLPSLAETYRELVKYTVEILAKFAVSRATDPKRTGHKPSPPPTGSKNGSIN